VKFHLFVVAGLAVCASSVSAQVCQGDLSFRNSSKHVGGAIGLGDNSTSFGAGLTVGHKQGWYSGASVGMHDYDGIDGNSVAVNGGVGYSMPLVNKSKWQLCPGGTLSLGFGPSFDIGGETMRLSSQTLTLGASVGTSVPMSKTVRPICCSAPAPAFSSRRRSSSVQPCCLRLARISSTTPSSASDSRGRCRANTRDGVTDRHYTNGAEIRAVRTSVPYLACNSLPHVQPCVGAGTLARHSASGNGNRLGTVWLGSARGSVLRSPNLRVSIHRCPPSNSSE
jgi:hypothetical protein